MSILLPYKFPAGSYLNARTSRLAYKCLPRRVYRFCFQTSLAWKFANWLGSRAINFAFIVFCDTTYVALNFYLL